MRDFLKEPGWVVLVIGLSLFGLHIYLDEPDLHSLLPVTVHRLTTQISFEPQDENVYVRTFIPQSDERQYVIEQKLSSGNLLVTQDNTDAGSTVSWFSASEGSRINVSHSTLLALKGVRYELDENLTLESTRLTDRSEISEYLKATPAIQVGHPEIDSLWQSIKPEDSRNLVKNLRAIYTYTSQDIEGAEFKGYTDALTALRLRQASCNGKGRLFVALARLNSIPARLVGGIILNEGQKKTSHQWVEVLISDTWVPFDPTNHYFAEIPSNYLVMYRGDEALFSHSRNINFDYLFNIEVNRLVGPQTRALIEQIEPSSWLARLFNELEFDAELTGTFLLFPLAALVVAICRNVIGMNSFGIFLPMLISAACRYAGLVAGLAGFILIVLIASSIRRSLEGARLLQIPRISALITAITGIIILMIGFGPIASGSAVTALVFFPVIVLSFAAERMHAIFQESTRIEAFKIMLSTICIISLCYLVFGSKFLHAVFLTYPELLLVVLAAQLFIGSWPGFRVSEYIRFRSLINKSIARGLVAAGPVGDLAVSTEKKSEPKPDVLGINERNIRLVNKLNSLEDMAAADDKIMTKSLLAREGVPVPRTLAIIHDFWDLQSITRQIPYWHSFVIKPSRGSQGKGILVIPGRDGENYLLAGGNALTLDELAKHIRDILSGVFSKQGERDMALVESILLPTPFYHQFFGHGLSDIRVILIKGQIVAAMLRIPTSSSRGKANLHQGAIGVPVEVKSGTTGDGFRKGVRIDKHPDTGVVLGGHQIPNWSRILEISIKSQHAIPLGYAGIDVADDISQGPVVVEINARPGLEIQNVHGHGFGNLVRLLTDIDKETSPERSGGIE